jgi:A/G-specific adenine glycosylase
VAKNNLNFVLPSQEKIQKFREDLLFWFKENGRRFPWRRKSSTIYIRIIAEVLLQRTQAENAARFLPSFLKKYPSWEKLAHVPEEELMEDFKPIGLWHQRSSSLKKLAIAMEKRKGRFPKSREELESLPGIGQYIANAVLLFRYKERQPLLDTNMARLLERYFGSRKLADIRDDPYLQVLSRKVLEQGDPIEINWAILDHAAMICKKIPRCLNCPLQAGCLFWNQNNEVRN